MPVVMRSISVRFHFTCLSPRVPSTLASRRLRCSTRGRYAIDPHPRTFRELSPVRRKCTPSRCLSARALFHCVSNPGTRVRSVVFHQISTPISPLLRLRRSKKAAKNSGATSIQRGDFRRFESRAEKECIKYVNFYFQRKIMLEKALS